MGKKGKDLYWIKQAARRVIFLCNEEADDGCIPRVNDVEEIIRESFEGKGD